jgi:MFS family permease
MFVALASLFAISLGYGVEIPQLPALVGKDNATPAMLSLLFVAYSTTRIVLQIPAGIWIDRSSPVRAMRLALAVNAIGAAIFIATTEPGLLVLARILGGAAAALTFPAAFAAVAGDPRVALGKGLGLVGAAAAFGMLAGFGIAGAMADRWGPRSPLVVVIAVCLVLLLVLVVRRAQAADGPARHAPKDLSSELRTLWGYARVPAFLGLILPVAFNKLSFTGLQSTLPLLGPDEFGLTTTGVAALFGATGVLFGLAQVVGGVAADRLRSLRVPTVVGATLAISLVGSARSETLAGFTVAFCAYIVCSSFVFAWTLRTLAARSDKESYAGVFGVFATITDLMTIVGPPLTLNLYGNMGRSAFSVLAVVALPFYVLFIALSRARSSPDVV